MSKSARSSSPSPSPKSQRRRRTRNLRPADARRLLDEHSRSGLTVAEFERRYNLSPNRLIWWRKRLGLSAVPSPRGRRSRSDAASVTFLPVRLAAAGHALPSPSPTPSPSPIELVLPDGTLVRISPSFDPVTLSRLLTVLRESTPC